LPEVPEGDAPILVRNLRRRESSHAVLLARSVTRRDLVTLLSGGIRGAISTDGTGEVPGHPASQHHGPELTAREVGVLQLVADGQSNKQIGEALELSALTVKSHLARISRKLGTGDRAEMVAYGIRNQLLG
ncbi:MAG TPA: LuxR C-terminal-related transcriptional regulator, partial [Actinotalea sp.]|nr:LuxR C-terminal-related transcriptional regulator [Actinotalea sp.]